MTFSNTRCVAVNGAAPAFVEHALKHIHHSAPTEATRVPVDVLMRLA